MTESHFNDKRGKKMKLFIIYSDLSDDLDRWKEVLTQMTINFKHSVCLVTPNVPETEARLLSMDSRFSQVCVSEMKNNKYHIHQITEAQRNMGFSEENTFIVMPDLLKGLSFQEIMPLTGVILMKEDKSHFRKLKNFSEKYTRSKSEEFSDVSALLMLTIYEHTHWWPITPKNNLEAQRNFLISVLNRADNFPKESKQECILKTQEDFIKKGMMDDVLFSPPNVTGLRWKMFSTTNTPMHDLIKNAETKNVVKPSQNPESQTTESHRLLSRPVSRYGAT